jgi:uncharacterized protein involved in outer membrane biogenesis
VKFLRTRSGKVVASTVLVMTLFLVRPGGEQLRARIVQSISMALGRQVDVGSVSLRFLPQPGFDLQNFVVHDDPAFGAEPVLQSSDVVAVLRVSSLLRGRLEIARLSLTEPSLNLVRNREGRWNLENLVERAARTPVAPTAKTRSERRPGFPYIEAERGRINLKIGNEKKAYALTAANFALWQDSENAWGVRLRAQPMRSDFNLSDTGTVELEGSWQRAPSLYETPLQLSVQWEGAQLGQVTKLTSGEDRGWRGAVQVTGTLAGTPNDLRVNSDVSIQDFRRYDIASDQPLRLAARCSARYSSSDHTFSKVDCRAPVGDGEMAVHGKIAVLSRSYDLTLLAGNLPVQALVPFVQRIKKNVPDRMVAAGKLNASISVHQEATANDARPVWLGEGEVRALNVTSPLSNTKLVLDRIPFTVSSAVNLGLMAKSGRTQTGASPQKGEAHADLGPFNIALGRSTSATVRGWASRSGYELQIQGDAEVQKLFEAARTVGLPAPQPAANGEARINIQVGGSWTGFAAPAVSGTAQLRSLQVRMRGLAAPIEVVSANVSLTANAAEIQKLTLSAAGNIWYGSLMVPRPCETPCVIRFDLHADEIATDKFNDLLNPARGTQPWYRFLSAPVQTTPYLASVHAIGKLTANRVQLKNMVVSHVSADAELEQSRLRLTKLSADIFGGRHSGEWSADFALNPPAFRGSGSLEKIALGRLAEAMHDNWITGTANLNYRASTAGWSRAELLSSADVSLQVEARDGALPHLALGVDSAPLRISRFIGRLLLREGKFQIDQGKLQTPSGIYQLSGTASLGRVLDIKLSREGMQGFSITGTLTQPHVTINTAPETQAALKP